LADYPCDAHLARYQGPSTRLYLNVYRDDLQAKFRMSVCDACLSDLVETWVGRGLHQTPEGYWDPPVDGDQLESLLVAPERPARPPRRLRTA
jgi:hypothetical protein